MIRVRFAPSPTGHIHIGNLRIALANWLYATSNGGEFVLRYDDTDQERSKSDYAESIAQDLNWLGIAPHQTYFQSQRFDLYDAAVEKLKAAGLVYPCYETAQELERRRKIRLSRRLPPIYGREALKLSQDERSKFEAEGRKPHWRFLLPNFDADPYETRRSEVRWHDLVRGDQVVDLASLSDPVLIRGDGSYLYTLPSIVDDGEMGISHIIRGDDHVTNTGVQIALFEALGLPVPNFGHINLLTDASGEGLSKRKGTLSLRSLRKQGLEPMALASLALLTGTAENVAPCRDMAELASHFHLNHVSKSAAKFAPEDLLILNRQLVHALEFHDVQERLKQLGIAGVNARIFWQAVRANLDKVDDAALWWQIIHDRQMQCHMLENDLAFFMEAASLLPQEPWDERSWQTWTTAIKNKTGRKGRALFHPLRLALTGMQQGPELAALMPLMGREIVLHRLGAWDALASQNLH